MHQVERTSARLWPDVCLLVAATVLLCAPLLTAWNHYGWQDWDQFTFRHETARLAWMRDLQWPVWNPYAMGGTALLAHPHFPGLSPWFVITMVSGAAAGVRLTVVLFMAVGAIGMARWLWQSGASRPAGVLGGVVFMMSAHYVLHVAEGHIEWAALGAMPWVAAALDRANVDRRAVIVAALWLASVVTFGAVYIPALFVVWFSCRQIAVAIQRRSWTPIVAWVAVAVLSGGVSAAKLLPTAYFTSAYPRPASELQHTSVRLVLSALFHPNPAAVYQTFRSGALDESTVSSTPPGLDERLAGFHEYSVYLSAVGTVLAMVGLFTTARRHWPVYAAGALAGVMVFGHVSPVDLWSWLRTLPLYEQLQLPSRMFAGVVFAAAFSAGMALDVCISRLTRLSSAVRTAVAWGIVALVYAELAVQAHGVFREVFRVTPVVLEASETFAQHPAPPEVAQMVPEPMHSLLMPRLEAGRGSLDGYENLSVTPGDVQVVGSPGYRGEVYLHEGGSARVVRWSMARVTVDTSSPTPGVLVMNQNFDPGWRVTLDTAGATVADAPALRTGDGLIAAAIPAGDHTVTFRYWPRGLTAGLWISLLSLMVCLLVWWRA